MSDTIYKVKKYCNSLTSYSRYKTRVVNVGDIPLGGDFPIRIQSMTTTDSMDTKATVEQTIRMVESGCDYVRITAPSKLEAQNLLEIKNVLRKRGYTVPLIADIHFTPNAAEIAARIVEKVRVNPGNYADRKKFQTIDYTDSEYEAELGRIREKFLPLVKICKEYGTAMRIGTNHGSLSDRIMSRYGDTPLGMVESALEFVRICEEMDYRSIILSMKASNPQIMVQAYRLLINKMEEENMNYPLHLGVTEAGGGEDGRIKSALGIGTLLEDGIGDTVRVSLTEDPEYEAPVAVQLVNRYKNRSGHKYIPPIEVIPYDPFTYNKRETLEIANFGGNNVPRVIVGFGGEKIDDTGTLAKIGYFYDAGTDKWTMSDGAPDYIYLGDKTLPFDPPNGLKIIYEYRQWLSAGNNFSIPMIKAGEYILDETVAGILKFVSFSMDDLNEKFYGKIRNDKKAVLVLETGNLHGMPEQRRVFMDLVLNEIQNPVIIKRTYNNIDLDLLRLYASTDIGGLLIDGFGDGAWIEFGGEVKKGEAINSYVRNLIKEREPVEKSVNRILFGILQAARTRISKTEYIACPSCGRTLFDLQETTDMIRKRTEHLKGIKIAVMGCIVNGPGEMADADYGYVGSGVSKITLYRGKDVVKRNIPSAGAVDALIEIIKEDNNWREPN